MLSGHKDVILNGRNRFLYLAVFLTALALRLMYLWESSDAPAFVSPIVDAETYEQRALTWLATGRISPMVFWQACFYHFFTSGIFALSGGSILAVKLVQALLGASTAALTAGIALCMFQRKTAGWIAGLGMAFYGPAIYFDGELLATSLSVFIGTLLLWFMIDKRRPQNPGWMFFIGMASMLAILTRPTFLPFFVLYWIWYFFKCGKNISSITEIQRPTNNPKEKNLQLHSCRPLIAWLLGAAIPALPAVLLSHHVTGRVTILPPSGGINLYIGNSENICKTLTARPGPAWDRILHEPQLAGYTSFQDRQRYFIRKTLTTALEHPENVTAGLLQKTHHLLSSRELPRNSDPYLIHRWSVLQRVLMWKALGFGFPCGIMFALASIGIVLYQRKIPTVLYLFLVSYGAGLVLVHVSARYRMPMIPGLLALATGGMLGFIDLAKSNLRHAIKLSVPALSILIISSMPTSFCMERVNYAAEYYWAVGLNNVRDRKYNEARKLYEASLNEDPDFAPALNGLGVEYGRKGQSKKAHELFLRAVESDPAYAEPWWNLATLAAQSGDIESRIKALTSGLQRAPWNTHKRNELRQLIAQKR